MGRWDSSEFGRKKKRRDFVIIAGVAGAGLLGLAALGISQNPNKNPSAVGLLGMNPFDYTIYQNGLVWYARNGDTGKISDSSALDIPSTDPVPLINRTITSMNEAQTLQIKGDFSTASNTVTLSKQIIYVHAGKHTVTGNITAVSVTGGISGNYFSETNADYGILKVYITALLGPSIRNANTSSIGIEMVNCDRARFEVGMIDSFNTGLQFDNVSSKTLADNDFYAITIQRCVTGIHFVGAASSITQQGNSFYDLVIFSCNTGLLVDSNADARSGFLTGTIDNAAVGGAQDFVNNQVSPTQGWIVLSKFVRNGSSVFQPNDMFTSPSDNLYQLLNKSNASIKPATTNTLDLGASTLAWRTIFVKTVENDTDDINLNPGPAKGVIANIDVGSSFRPGVNDNGVDNGVPTRRWRNVYSGTSYQIIGTSGDANPKAQLISDRVSFGPGGVTAVDTYLARISANLLETDATLRPSLDSTYNLGDDADSGASNLRWNRISVRNISSGFNTMSFRAGNGGNFASFNVSNIQPVTTNVSDLGTTSLIWANIYGNKILFGTTQHSSITDDGSSQISSTSGSFVDQTTGNGKVWQFQKNSTIGVRILGDSGKIDTYAQISVVGFGVPAIVAEGDLTGQTGTVASVAAYTVGASNGVFKVGGDIDVTAFTSGTINLQVTYTDWNNSSQTVTIDSVALLADAPGNEVTIMAKASTSITIKTTGTFTATYNVAATIIQVK